VQIYLIKDDQPETLVADKFWKLTLPNLSIPDLDPHGFARVMHWTILYKSFSSPDALIIYLDELARECAKNGGKGRTLVEKDTRKDAVTCKCHVTPFSSSVQPLTLFNVLKLLVDPSSSL
jgi:hypothetical protein